MSERMQGARQSGLTNTSTLHYPSPKFTPYNTGSTIIVEQLLQRHFSNIKNVILLSRNNNDDRLVEITTVHKGAQHKTNALITTVLRTIMRMQTE